MRCTFWMVPISALAYELIRYAARMPDGFMATLLRAPGLTLQRMTTAEPDERQLDVAVVALREALGAQAGDNIITAPYRRDAPAGPYIFWSSHVCQAGRS